MLKAAIVVVHVLALATIAPCICALPTVYDGCSELHQPLDCTTLYSTVHAEARSAILTDLDCDGLSVQLAHQNHTIYVQANATIRLYDLKVCPRLA